MSTTRPKIDLKNEEGNVIYHELFEKSPNGQLKHGTIKQSGDKFDVPEEKVWKFGNVEEKLCPAVLAWRMCHD